jgi:AcrR family transcriptional regulator
MSSPGLRERKKQKTRWAIQEHALRLFRAHGYEQTTVEQIAAAAEVSPSTFFRYFKTKEDVVLADEFDPMLVEFVGRAPATASPVGALRFAIKQGLAQLDQTALDAVLERTQLMFSVPALRMRTLDNFVNQVDLIAGALAGRANKPVDDPQMRVFAGAVTGALIMALMQWQAAPDRADLATVIDQSLAVIEPGPPDHR